MKKQLLCAVVGLSILVSAVVLVFAHEIPSNQPLPEHPRPDFQRPHWMNLNGFWDFQFDSRDAGRQEAWFKSDRFSDRIRVPFSWGSPLSGVEDAADIGWYGRSFEIPPEWRGRRVFLVVSACDWHTTAWLNGEELGSHQGGYTPFEFEITRQVSWGVSQRLVLRVDDRPRPFKLEGKQGYGPARGIWQTPYLEARGQHSFQSVHFLPRLDSSTVTVRARLLEPASEELTFKISSRSTEPAFPDRAERISAGSSLIETELALPEARLWSLEDPYLYRVEVSVSTPDSAPDLVQTYFGMRSIQVVRLPGSGIPYVGLNGKPVYLQMTLDQAYHPEGFYTFPSDAFMRDEILRSRRLGLNGMRVHVKVPLPRKLYWADRLGMLIMADVPNSWGEPTREMRAETEKALFGMIDRDFNHPSIFSWVLFNETWGLETDDSYREETQDWVGSLYRKVKEIDPTRLVEDNSPNKEDHVDTDLNTWHAYLPGFAWAKKLEEVSSRTFPGSDWNFIGDRRQEDQPMLNSEWGNVWGYEGSTGDVDWSWDYHLGLNQFRRYPKVAGWLYTEHHDVVNEWNGYYRYDRSEKFTGLEELVEGMTLRDLHAPFFVSPAGELSREVEPGTEIELPLWLSIMTGEPPPGDRLILTTELYGWDSLGRKQRFSRQERDLEFAPWRSEAIEPLRLRMPRQRSLLILAMSLESPSGVTLQRNFTTFVVTEPETSSRDEDLLDRNRSLKVLRFSPASYSAARWDRHWEVLEGLKVNATGSGFFEYQVEWPSDLSLEEVQGASIHLEMSARRLLAKDLPSGSRIEGSYMRGAGTHDPARNPNAYPMTDEDKHPTAVRILVNGVSAGLFDLPDDPADHRGVLSWHYQLRDGHLRDAGTYGFLVEAAIPGQALAVAARQGKLQIRLEVDSALAGGLAVYGERFGRYPMDPSIVFLKSRAD